jgi:rRNA maturation protein Rpf1
MSSLKNSPGAYCLEQQGFKQTDQYLSYKYSQIPLQSKFPGLGINVGSMRGGYFNNVLSNNASNIESHLYGIKQIDLTKTPKPFVAQLNKLDEQKFFKTPRVFVPEPLVVQKKQRPVGPFSGV